MSMMSAPQRRNQSVVVLESTVPKPTPQLQIVVCPDWTTIILMMATLIFICDDGMDGVAAMGNGVGIHLWQRCNCVCMCLGDCMATDWSAARKRNW